MNCFVNFLRNINKLLLITLIVVAAVLTGCSSAPSKPETANIKGSLDSLGEVDNALYTQAIEALKQKKYSSAERDLKILLTRRDDISEVWTNYALSLYHQNKLPELRSALNAMDKNNFKQKVQYNLKGLMAAQSGQFKEASAYYNTALKMDSNYANAWFNLALLHDVYLQNVKEAVHCYEQYLAIVPDDEQTKSWLEHLKYSMGDTQ